MKLTDFLMDVGRPVAYYPRLALALGGVKQAVFLCQLVYWSDKGSNPDGWIYKTQEELRQETGMSEKEQRTARRDLVLHGILEERHARVEHRMYYRVNSKKLDEVWEKFVGDESALTQTPNGQFSNSPSGTSRNSQRAGEQVPNGPLRNGTNGTYPNSHQSVRYKDTESTNKEYFIDD